MALFVKNWVRFPEFSFIVKFVSSETSLSSIIFLRKEVEQGCKEDLREIVMQMNLVGAVNTLQCLAQSTTKILLCNTQKLW